MHKIRLVSRILQIIFLFMLIALPLVSIIFWFFPQIPDALGIKTNFFPASISGSAMFRLDPGARFLGFLVNVLPLSIKMFCLYSLIKLFKLYETGKIFTLENVKYIRYIALTLIVQEVLKPFNQMITTYIMTSNKIIAISINNGDINNILIGVVILLASWIMAEASKLHEEHTLTI